MNAYWLFLWVNYSAGNSVGEGPPDGKAVAPTTYGNY